MKKIKEAADIYTILGWIKRNRNVFSRKDLIQQIVARFHISPEWAEHYLSLPLKEAKMLSFNKYKLSPEQEDSLMYFVAEKVPNLLAGPQIMQVVEWYENHGWLTQKQVEFLTKHRTLNYQSKKKEALVGGSFSRASNYPIQSGLPPTTVKEAFQL